MGSVSENLFATGLGFNYYQQEAFKTAKYPEFGTGSLTALAYTGLGLGEAGEVQGKIKKIFRDCGGTITPEKKEEIASEMGDVLWYLALMATELGFDFEHIAQKNLDKLSGRTVRGTIGGSGDNR